MAEDIILTEKTEGDIKTMWTKGLFGTEKPIIALLHLDPLPGDPDFCGSLDTVIEHASCDVKALQEGGVDGVLIANEFSFPMTYVSHAETLMAMACVIGAIKKDIHVPFGTNVVMNPEETIRMAKAVGASFGRSAFAGAFTGTYGVHVNNFGENVRLKYALGIPEMKLLCKINPEGDVLLAEQSIEEIIDNVTLGDHVGAFCVSGPGAGQEASWDLLAHVCDLAKAKHVPVFCNTGCKESTIAKIREMVDSNTVVGEPIQTVDGVTIIPVSKISIGLGGGGSDFVSSKAPAQNPFGGGVGAGVKVTPVCFLVVKDGNVRILTIAEPANTTADRIVEMVPETLDRISALFEKKKE